ncbi:unnamed protein product [Acanthoscelides obtectus]|uniref:Uncharacterized protein n=1 Tax=Acanthoscelides obtectus TaxID=200917 RepID=A0A9P0JSN0_ACAOB|nr:unnamed protein product [Acanthoscelides obtectus]CAK1661046.1 hypothetical protein AOBTE_LOCUS22396 [Acanthoscelides obtectus]
MKTVVKDGSLQSFVVIEWSQKTPEYAICTLLMTASFGNPPSMTKRQDIISSRRSQDDKLRDKEQEQLLKALQRSIDDYSSYQKSTSFQNYSDFLTVFSSWQCPYGWHKIVQDKVTLFKLEYKPAPIISHSVIVVKYLNVET